VSPQFTEYQKHSINFKDVPFELWEIKRYENELISLVEHQSSSNESISSISTDPESVVSKVSREVQIYSEEHHLENKNDMVLELYNKIKIRIIDLGDVEIVPRKQYIVFTFIKV
jgi:hypothetical protein